MYPGNLELPGNGFWSLVRNGLGCNVVVGMYCNSGRWDYVDGLGSLRVPPSHLTRRILICRLIALVSRVPRIEVRISHQRQSYLS